MIISCLWLYLSKAFQGLQPMSQFIHMAHKTWHDLIPAHHLLLHHSFCCFPPSAYSGLFSATQIHQVPFCFGSFTHALFFLSKMLFLSLSTDWPLLFLQFSLNITSPGQPFLTLWTRLVFFVTHLHRQPVLSRWPFISVVIYSGSALMLESKLPDVKDHVHLFLCCILSTQDNVTHVSAW